MLWFTISSDIWVIEVHTANRLIINEIDKELFAYNLAHLINDEVARNRIRSGNIGIAETHFGGLYDTSSYSKEAIKAINHFNIKKLLNKHDLHMDENVEVIIRRRGEI